MPMVQLQQPLFLDISEEEQISSNTLLKQTMEAIDLTLPITKIVSI